MKKIYILGFVLFCLNITTFAQGGHKQHGNRENMPKVGVIKGVVIDIKTLKPVQYANVALYNQRDSSLVTGAISDQAGTFILKELPFGRYFLVSDFIGYYKDTTSGLKVVPRNKIVNCGEIKLKKSEQAIEAVEVVGEKNNIDYKIDRRVINVSKDLNATGGSLTDVLENTPSIQVDIDGNVQLRGSSNFLVLIDGKPTVLDASDVLNQIPASSVENIEIITNPSAKFDPDGTAGIINVIMKKEHKSGFNGIINASVGTRDKYKTDFLLNYRIKKMNFYVGGNYTDQHNYGKGISARTSLINADTFLVLNSTENMQRNIKTYAAKAGIDYYLNDNNTISAGAEYGYFGYFRNMYRNNVASTKTGTLNSVSETSIPSEYSKTVALFGVGGSFFNSNVDYTHKFAKKGHEIVAWVSYSGRGGGLSNHNTEQITNKNFTPNDTYPATDIKTFQDRNARKLTYKIDYTLPLTSISKIEAGYQGRNLNAGGPYTYQYFDNSIQNWATDATFTNDLEFTRNIQSVYATYSGEIIGIGYLAGIRGEYTDRLINQKATNQKYTINRFDFFPTLHLSKELAKGQELQASYSRRIERPRYWLLNPFPSYSDSYSSRVGNPDLSPEYTDSYELGYQKSFGKSFFSTQLYYRLTNNSISHIQQLLPNGQFLYTFDNLNATTAFGTEISANISATKWLRFFIMGNLYNYNLEGDIAGVSSNANSTNYDARLNTTIMFTKNSRLQITNFYRSPSVTTQGTELEMYGFDFAYKHQFFKQKLAVTLKVRDPFKLQNYTHNFYSTNFWSESTHYREQQVFLLNLSYKINNYKKGKTKQGGELDL